MTTTSFPSIQPGNAAVGMQQQSQKAQQFQQQQQQQQLGCQHEIFLHLIDHGAFRFLPPTSIVPTTVRSDLDDMTSIERDTQTRYPVPATPTAVSNNTEAANKTCQNLSNLSGPSTTANIIIGNQKNLDDIADNKDSEEDTPGQVTRESMKEKTPSSNSSNQTIFSEHSSNATKAMINGSPPSKSLSLLNQQKSSVTESVSISSEVGTKAEGLQMPAQKLKLYKPSHSATNRSSSQHHELSEDTSLPAGPNSDSPNATKTDEKQSKNHPLGYKKTGRCPAQDLGQQSPFFCK
jgi:hypothetical protein